MSLVIIVQTVITLMQLHAGAIDAEFNCCLKWEKMAVIFFIEKFIVYTERHRATGHKFDI